MKNTKTAPFPGSHPTNPPLCHSKVPVVPSPTVINDWEPCGRKTTTVDSEDSDADETDEEREEDEEVTEDNIHWTQPPFTAGQYIPPPTVAEAAAALSDLKLLIQPCRTSGIGHKDPKLDLLLWSRLKKMRMFLWNYTKPVGACRWQAASLMTANAYEKSTWLAGRLRQWTRAYILDRNDLPFNIYGTWNSSILEDEDFKGELLLHLQGIGKCTHSAKAQEAHFTHNSTTLDETCGIPMVKDTDGTFGLNFSRALGFMRLMEVNSTYYANDHRKIRWVHKSETAVPYAKGEGASLMVADMVSPDYGWLQSPDGKQHARVLFKAGKARDGYFTTQNILDQASNAMDILRDHFPDEDHVMVFDNATTHLKRADDALYARKMPKYPPKHGKDWDGSDWGAGRQPKNWGVEVNVVDENGKPVYSPSGEIKKTRVRMCGATFADGSPQSLYYSEGHELAGVFKGMATILHE
ncbi:uncharacterized protein EDB91DRAFT_1244688 [Suillus paluster]|uniref:uncharacterized protein n=1 Tax=Suillus paluster TaxID=48578 RepID=UPI001B85F617|nr:uncharacterized protein EDB91DRAFT_1244688 [Suillus paluster]KAG1748879.1 hypothetical protein EDB91DRAFT_1244688 [Suillus paluster]